MRRIFIFFLMILLIGCKPKVENQRPINPIVQETTTTIVPANVVSAFVPQDSSRTYIHYRQYINGYKVEVEWLKGDYIDEHLVFGDVLIHFIKEDGKGFTVHNPIYWDERLNAKEVRTKTGATFEIDYTLKNDKYLATNTPFYFEDMDFDGKDELVVVEWKGGRQSAHVYVVYDINDYYADKITSPPFDHIEQNITKFFPEKKQIVNSYVTLFRGEYLTYERVKVNASSSFTVDKEGFVLNSVVKKDFEGNEETISDAKGKDLPQVHIEYRQKVNGYKVNVLWLSYCQEGEESEMGQAIMHFTHNDGDDFYVYCPSYSDSHLYQNGYIVKDDDHIALDYVQKDNEYLASASPFYFSDMDFDGKDELVIVNWVSGAKGGHIYDVYEIHQHEAIKKSNPPFNDLQQYFTKFIPDEKTIVNYRSDVWSAEYRYFTIKPSDSIDENGEIVTTEDLVLDKVEYKDDRQTSVYRVIDGRFKKER